MKYLLGMVVGMMLSTIASASAGGDAQEVIKCMQRNFVERGVLRQLEVTTTDRAGKQSQLALNMYWKPFGDGARISLQVTQPKDLEGSAYLIQETKGGADELYVYLPAVGKVRKISGAARGENLWGTDFSYEEFKLVQGLTFTGASKKMPDAVVGDRPTFVMETKLDGVESAVSKVLAYVDQKSCTLLKSELFNQAGNQVKVLQGDLSMLFETSDYGDRPIWMLLGYTMKDLERGSQSVVQLSEISLLEKAPPSLFEPDSFFQAPAAAAAE
jgi:hypothetical protein